MGEENRLKRIKLVEMPRTVRVDKLDGVSDRDFLWHLGCMLLEGDREGSSVDIPEGARYVNISDTLASHWGKNLKRIAKGLQ
jgi:hypothetical protein